MPVNPPVTQNPPSFTALDIITDAMVEVGMVAPGETPDGDTAQWALRKMNYLLDFWASKKSYVYAVGFQEFNLVANLSPHTIGPGGPDPNNPNTQIPATFPVSQRPVRIESISLVINSLSGGVDLPMNPRDADWWALNRVKAIQTNVPTDYYYAPTWPNGSIFFWPVPNISDPVRLELWTQINQISQINDPIGGPLSAASLPPAYRAALMLTLAETLQPGNRQQGNQQLSAMAAAARMAVFGNNLKSPRFDTYDAGMPKTGKPLPTFNWVTGDLT